MGRHVGVYGQQRRQGKRRRVSLQLRLRNQRRLRLRQEERRVSLQVWLREERRLRLRQEKQAAACGDCCTNEGGKHAAR